MAVTPSKPRSCEALLPDEVTPCEVPVPAPKRLCSPHHKEYKALTKAYKEIQERVAVLKKHGDFPPSDILALRTIEGVNRATVHAQKWSDMLAREIRGRRDHHKRFFRSQDAGHDHRLRVLARELRRATGVVEQLRAHRERLVSENRSRINELIRQQEQARPRVASNQHPLNMPVEQERLRGQVYTGASRNRAVQTAPVTVRVSPPQYQPAPFSQSYTSYGAVVDVEAQRGEWEDESPNKWETAIVLFVVGVLVLMLGFRYWGEYLPDVFYRFRDILY